MRATLFACAAGARAGKDAPLIPPEAGALGAAQPRAAPPPPTERWPSRLDNMQISEFILSTMGDLEPASAEDVAPQAVDASQGDYDYDLEFDDDDDDEDDDDEDEDDEDEDDEDDVDDDDDRELFDEEEEEE